MYELTCPSCKHKVKRPFLRLGAQSVCESCAHRFVVQSEYVTRRGAVPPDTGEDKDNPLLLSGTVSKPPPPPRPAAAPTPPPQQQQREQGVPISTVAGAPPAKAPELTPIHQIPAHQEPSPDVARVIARHRARRKRRGRLIAAGVTLGVLIVIAVVVMILTGGGGEAGDQSIGDIDLQMVSAQRLKSAEWVTVEDETFDGTLPESRIELENDRMEPFNSQFMMYTAEVRATGFDVVEQASLHLLLVDDGSNTLIARCQLPLMLLSGHRTETPRRPITVFVPRDLAERGRVMSWVQVKDVMPGGAMFPNVIHEPLNDGTHTAIKITAFNPLDSEINRCVFLVSAYDDKGATVARWRVEHKRRIGPQQRVEFAALTPVEPHWNVHSWQVVGAGGVTFDGETSDTAP